MNDRRSNFRSIVMWIAFASVVSGILYLWGDKFGDAGMLAVVAVAGVTIRQAILSRMKEKHNG